MTEEMKKAAGYKAAEYVRDGMVVGLGTGSTAFFFIEKLIEMYRDGLKIQAIASSKRSHEQAQKGNIPLLNESEMIAIDLTVDGADEIDPKKRMIKGGGGALLREKIVASSSRELIIIVDESKCVESLGKVKIPVEILPFAYRATLKKIEDLGYRGEIRGSANGKNYTTDNGNWIFDIHTESHLSHPEKDHEVLLQIPGVLETGFFCGFNPRLIVGKKNGDVKLL